MTLAYFCAYDRHLKKKLQKPISRRLLGYSYSDVIVHSHTAWNGLTGWMEYVTLTFTKTSKRLDLLFGFPVS